MNNVLFSVLLLVGFCAALFAQQDRIFIPDRAAETKLIQQETVLAAPQFELEPITPPEDLEPPLVAQSDDPLVTGRRQAGHVEPMRAMTKQVRWEYKVSTNSGPLQEHQLIRFGQDGWELASTTVDNNTFTTVFKRPKQ